MTTKLVTLAEALASGRSFRRHGGREFLPPFCDTKITVGDAIANDWEVESEPDPWPTPWHLEENIGSLCAGIADLHGRVVLATTLDLGTRIVAAVNLVASLGDEEEWHVKGPFGHRTGTLCCIEHPRWETVRFRRVKP